MQKSHLNHTINFFHTAGLGLWHLRNSLHLHYKPTPHGCRMLQIRHLKCLWELMEVCTWDLSPLITQLFSLFPLLLSCSNLSRLRACNPSFPDPFLIISSRYTSLQTIFIQFNSTHIIQWEHMPFNSYCLKCLTSENIFNFYFNWQYLQSMKSRLRIPSIWFAKK